MSQKGMGDLLKQVTRMRKDMDRVNEELKDRYIETSVGGDRVKVTFNGQQELVKISISDDLIGGDVDRDMLEDLIVAAVNAGVEKSKELMSQEMNDATGGLAAGFPGMF